MPVLVLNDVEDGSTALLFSTQYDKELEGTEVVHPLMHEEFWPETVHGAVIVIPVANPLAFMHATYHTWIDNWDVGYVSVENPQGNTTERDANAIWTEAWSQADVVLNFYCTDHPDSLYFQIIEPTGETEADLDECAYQQSVAEAFAIDPNEIAGLIDHFGVSKKQFIAYFMISAQLGETSVTARADMAMLVTESAPSTPMPEGLVELDDAGMRPSCSSTHALQW